MAISRAQRRRSRGSTAPRSSGSAGPGCSTWRCSPPRRSERCRSSSRASSASSPRPADVAQAALISRSGEAREGPLPHGAAWEALVAENRPVLFKGAAADWPLVQAGLTSDEAAAALLVEGWAGPPVVVYRRAPEIEGRFAYTPQVDGFNFAASREPLDAVLREILDQRGDPHAQSIYVGSTDLGLFFPKLGEAVAIDLGAIHPMLAEHPGL